MHLTKHITRTVAVQSSPRLAQVLGMFDVEQPEISTQSWEVDLHLPDRWNIGVIVGPSGSGKTTIARELFGEHFTTDFGWSATRSILDGFPLSLTVKQVTGLLSSVGFSSPPAWVRPFACLSNGQQFRVNLARTLAEAMVDGQMKVMDEYSSVVDRTVAQIGSAAVARTVRKSNLQFIAVTCHYDVLDWLEPDWVYDILSGAGAPAQSKDPAPKSATLPHSQSSTAAVAGSFGSGECASAEDISPSREGLRPFHRPEIEMEIIRTDRSAWQRFKPHHYLSAALNPSAACYVAIVKNQPAAFTAVLPFPHPTHSGWREHRTVCLPDYQGVGIGNAMSEFVASIYRATGKPYTSTTSHPAMIYHRAKSPLWRMSRKPGLSGDGRRFSLMRKTAAIDRLTAGFEYVGPARFADARRFEVIR
jgi:ABC-type phosphate/phosphonate transport system ATPase subunit